MPSDDPPGMIDDPAGAFHRLVGALDYPMFIATAAARGRRAGCLVGFATQASIEPPRMLVLISKGNRTSKVADDADALALHFLDRADRNLASLFGEETGDEVDKFAHCDWHEGPGSVPILERVAGWVAGPVLARHDLGDHVAHPIEVGEAACARPGHQLGFQHLRGTSPGHPA
ncbi:MAG: flavin reductase family protein [Acidimicrobiales bacterium]